MTIAATVHPGGKLQLPPRGLNTGRAEVGSLGRRNLSIRKGFCRLALLIVIP